MSDHLSLNTGLGVGGLPYGWSTKAMLHEPIRDAKLSALLQSMENFEKAPGGSTPNAVDADYRTMLPYLR